MSQISSVRLDTHVTPNQGATVASAAIERGGPQIRAAAAEARQALLTLASQEARRAGRSTHSVERRRLRGGRRSRSRHVRRPARRQAVRHAVHRHGPAEALREYTHRRHEPSASRHPGKVSGTYTYVQHVRLPGMLHGRVVRPRGQGAYARRRTHRQRRRIVHREHSRRPRRPASAISSPSSSPTRVGRRARRAAAEGDVGHPGVARRDRWSLRSDALGEDDGFRDRGKGRCRRGPRPRSARGERDVPRAVSGDTRRSARTAPSPMSRRPAHGDVLDAEASTARATRWQECSASRRRTCACRYFEGAGTFGRSCYDDAAQAAAIVSKEVGAPVRVQFSRADEHGWDNFGPGASCRCESAASMPTARSWRTNTTAGSTSGRRPKRPSSWRSARRPRNRRTGRRGTEQSRRSGRCTTSRICA